MLYQIFRRWDRLCDPFQKYVLPSSLISLYLLSHQHIAFLVNLLVIFRMVLYTCFSQVLLEYLAKQKNQKLMKCKIKYFKHISWLTDLLLKDKQISEFLKMESFYVIDFNMEYDKGLNNPYFPEYRTRLASKL